MDHVRIINLHSENGFHQLNDDHSAGNNDDARVHRSLCGQKTNDAPAESLGLPIGPGVSSVLQDKSKSNVDLRTSLGKGFKEAGIESKELLLIGNGVVEISWTKLAEESFVNCFNSGDSRTYD